MPRHSLISSSFPPAFPTRWSHFLMIISSSLHPYTRSHPIPLPRGVAGAREAEAERGAKSPKGASRGGSSLREPFMLSVCLFVCVSVCLFVCVWLSEWRLLDSLSLQTISRHVLNTRLFTHDSTPFPDTFLISDRHSLPPETRFYAIS